MSHAKPPPMQVTMVNDDESRVSTPEELSFGKKAKRSQSFASFAPGTTSPKSGGSVNIQGGVGAVLGGGGGASSAPTPLKRGKSFAALKRKNSNYGRRPSSLSEMRADEDVTNNSKGGGGANSGAETRMKFPTYEELQLLPEEIRETLMQLVLDFLKQRLYPRMLFLARRRAKKNAIAVVQQQVPTVPTSFLQQIPFFSRWSNLDAIVNSLELQLFDKDEILCQQGECEQSGIFFLVQGTISVRKLKKLPENLKFIPKGCGDHLTEQVRLLEPMTCYGEKIFLTEEPRMETLRTTTRCSVWVLKHRQFFSIFDSLPDDRRRAVLENAYERRREIMPIVFPIDEELLGEAPLFSDTPPEVRQQLAARMEPRVYAKGSNICKIGQAGNEMYYIGRGSIRMSMIAVEGDEPLVSTVHPGTIVGEMGVFSTKKRNITLHCQTACDVYAMDHELIKSAVSSQAIMSRILRRAHALQTEYQEHSRKHHFEWISNIPLLNSVGGPKLHQAILDACEGKVYPLNSSIISVSECCDRLVLFTRGKARISSMNVDLKVGEALGFTCLIPHRWAYHVVAGETVESVEISYLKLKKILTQFGVYDQVKQLSLGLLYPRVHPEAFQQAIATARHYCNPPCFPTSLDYDPKPFAARVNHHGPNSSSSSSSMHQQHLSPVNKSTNKPKKRLENLYAPGPGPVQRAPIDTKHFALEAAQFIEALDREEDQNHHHSHYSSGGGIASDEDGGLLAGGSGAYTSEEREAFERKQKKEAEIKRQRAETRKRLTMDKPKHMARTRNTDEMERLSRKIRELERQQAASVPPPSAKLSSLSPQNRRSSSQYQQQQQNNSSSTSSSPQPRRSTSLPPINPKKAGGSSIGGGGGGGDLDATQQQQQQNELAVVKLSRTIAIQTDKSYLHAKSLKAQREQQQKANPGGAGSGGNSPTNQHATGGSPKSAQQRDSPAEHRRTVMNDQ